MKRVYILRSPDQGYFRGTLDLEDVVWTMAQSRALRFTDKDLAELAMVEHAPSASVVRLKPRSQVSSPAEPKK